MSGDSVKGWRVILFTDFPVVAEWYRHFLAAERHQLVAVVTSSKRDFDYLGVARAVQPDTDVLISSRPRRWAGMLAPLRPDLIVATIFPLKIPAEVLALPRLGAINIHPSLLPRYRGTMTPLWVMRHGEREWGQTLHRMTPDFDAGPILAQERVEVEDDDHLATLMPKLFGVMPALWRTALPRIATGDPGDPQDEAGATYFGAIPDMEAWRRIDWSRPAREVHDVVRSCAWPLDEPMGAIGEIDGVPWRIVRTRLVEAARGDVPVGRVVGGAADAPLVQCGDGPLLIVEGHPC